MKLTTKDYIEMGIKDKLVAPKSTVEILDNFLAQPIEGLLYDLCLLPEEISVQDESKKRLLWLRMLAIIRLTEKLAALTGEGE